MQPTLTDGKTILEPDLVEFHPLSSPTPDDADLRLELQHLFGPLRQRLLPGKSLLWWGTFALADRVGLTAYSCKGARLRLRILDLEFRVIEEVVAGGGSQRLAVQVPRSGLVFFQVINEGGSDEVLFLQVGRSHCGSFLPSRPLALRLARWVRRLGQTIRGSRGRLVAGAARPS